MTRCQPWIGAGPSFIQNYTKEDAVLVMEKGSALLAFQARITQRHLQYSFWNLEIASGFWNDHQWHFVFLRPQMQIFISFFPLKFWCSVVHLRLKFTRKHFSCSSQQIIQHRHKVRYGTKRIKFLQGLYPLNMRVSLGVANWIVNGMFNDKVLDLK